MNKLKVSAGVAASIAAAVTLFAGPALATAPNGCGTNYSVCMYQDDNFTGGGVFYSGAGTKGNLTGFNDQTNSWYNNSNLDAKWFYNSNQGGTSRCMNSFSSNHSLSFADYDEASSYQIYTDQLAC